MPPKEKSSTADPLPGRDLVALSLDRIAAILVRAGIDSPHAEKLLRRAFIMAAYRSATSIGGQATQSQVASIAGVSRLEVRKALEERNARARSTSSTRNTRIDRLIHGWRTDKRFNTPQGRPRPLSLGNGTASFNELVRIYGRDVTSRTLRDQLVRKGLARELCGKLHLDEAAYISQDSSGDSTDLRFIASQLKAIDFAIGHRAYVTKRLTLLAGNRKALMAMRQIASTRLETVLSSLESMSIQTSGKKSQRGLASHRLLINASIATESEES